MTIMESIQAFMPAVYYGGAVLLCLVFGFFCFLMGRNADQGDDKAAGYVGCILCAIGAFCFFTFGVLSSVVEGLRLLLDGPGV